MSFIVQLEDSVWIAEHEGDPGRTTAEDNAQRFDSLEDAYDALAAARTHRPFGDAMVVDETAI